MNFSSNYFLSNQNSSDFCRNCLKFVSKTVDQKCISCKKSMFLPEHKEAFTLSFAHIDCDAFYASVEKSDNPDYKDKVVLISPVREYGVISSACYNARRYGINAPMLTKEALKLCPEAIVIHPNIKRYKEVSHELHKLMRKLTPMVESVSVDEAFLDLKGTEKFHKAPPSVVLSDFAKQIEKTFGITISIGLSYCKFLAKIASSLDKPFGFFIIGKSDAFDFLTKKSISLLWGVGKKTQENFHKDNIFTFQDLRQCDPSKLEKKYGVLGRKVFDMAFGIDNRPIEPDKPVKNFSAEKTFTKATRDKIFLLNFLDYFSTKLSHRLKTEKLKAKTISIKLRTPDFKTYQRSFTLNHHTYMAHEILKTAKILFSEIYKNQNYRLIGLKVSNLEKENQSEQLSLFEKTEKLDKIEKVIDDLRSKFGHEIIKSGNFFYPKN